MYLVSSLSLAHKDPTSLVSLCFHHKDMDELKTVTAWASVNLCSNLRFISSQQYDLGRLAYSSAKWVKFVVQIVLEQRDVFGVLEENVGFLENWEDMEEHESADCQQNTNLLFP